jgi:predicted AAA+ superfamily ATPase
MTELIDRSLKITAFLVPGKALILYGPRRAGKTTLLKSYLDSCGLRYRLETGDDVRIRNLLRFGRFNADCFICRGIRVGGN